MLHSATSQTPAERCRSRDRLALAAAAALCVTVIVTALLGGAASREPARGSGSGVATPCDAPCAEDPAAMRISQRAPGLGYSR